MEFPQQPQQQRPAGDGKIIYPLGVKEITDKISNDEVVKRLKVRANGGGDKCNQITGMKILNLSSFYIYLKPN